MKTAAQLVARAHREGNLIPVGTEPTNAQMAEGLEVLNDLILGILGFELGELLGDWAVPPPQRTAPVPARYPLGPAANDLPSGVWPYPPANVRLVSSIAAATTVYLPNAPNDGARIGYVDVGAIGTLTLNGNGRMIDGALTITVPPNSTFQSWLYRADRAEWISILDLEETDNSPLPPEFDRLLICATAIGLAPRFGLEPRTSTVTTYKTMLTKLKARYRQPTAVLNGSADSPSSMQSFGGVYDGRSWMT